MTYLGIVNLQSFWMNDTSLSGLYGIFFVVFVSLCFFFWGGGVGSCLGKAVCFCCYCGHFLFFLNCFLVDLLHIFHICLFSFFFVFTCFLFFLLFVFFFWCRGQLFNLHSIWGGWVRCLGNVAPKQNKHLKKTTLSNKCAKDEKHSQDRVAANGG